MLPEHDEDEDEVVDVLADEPFVEDGSFFSSSCKSLPISARVSVRFSISVRSGTFALTLSTKLFTTSLAHVRSFATSSTAPLIALPILDIILLSLSRARSCLSDSAGPLLFLFVFLQSGISGGLTSRSSSNARVSSFDFLTSSRY